MTELNELNTETTVIDETAVNTERTSEESKEGETLGTLMLIGAGIIAGVATYGLCKVGKMVATRIDKWAAKRVERKKAKQSENDTAEEFDNNEN